MKWKLLIKCLRNWRQAEKKGRLEGFTLTSYEEVNGRTFSVGVNFINFFRANFLNKSIFSSYVLALNEVFYENHMRTNVDEIDARLPFFSHQVNWFFTRFLIKLSLTQIIYWSTIKVKFIKTQWFITKWFIVFKTK
jgi:hypothetical protein